MERPSLKKDGTAQFGYLVLSGTEHGQLLAPHIVEQATLLHGEWPPGLQMLVEDTDSRVAQLSSLASGAVRAFPLAQQVNLQEMVALPQMHPEVARTLAEFAPDQLPSDLSKGSQKIPAYTLAAMQARWLGHDGLLRTMQEQLAALQREAFRSGAREVRFHAATVGLAPGGVGSIAPLIAAAALGTFAKYNAGLASNVDVTGVFVEPDPNELTQERIAANTGACYTLLERALAGRFSVPMPGHPPYNVIGGMPLYRYVFLASQVSEVGNPGREEFRRALARFLVAWVTGDPVTEGVQNRLADHHAMEVML